MTEDKVVQILEVFKYSVGGGFVCKIRFPENMRARSGMTLRSNNGVEYKVKGIVFESITGNDHSYDCLVSEGISAPETGEVLMLV